MVPDGGKGLALSSVKCVTHGEVDPETGETGVALERQSNRVNSDLEPIANGLCSNETLERVSYTVGKEKEWISKGKC